MKVRSLFMSVIFLAMVSPTNAVVQGGQKPVWESYSAPTGSIPRTSYRHTPCTITPFADNSGVDIVLYYLKPESKTEYITQYSKIFAENGKVRKSHFRVDTTLKIDEHKVFSVMTNREDRFPSVCAEVAKKLPSEVRRTFWGEYGLGVKP